MKNSTLYSMTSLKKPDILYDSHDEYIYMSNNSVVDREQDRPNSLYARAR